MVIDNGGIGKSRLNTPTQSPENTKAANQGGAGNTATSATAGDSVSLSGAGQAMSRLEANIQNQPDVDTAKVEQIKNAISNGSYQADPSAIADKMLSDF